MWIGRRKSFLVPTTDQPASSGVVYVNDHPRALAAGATLLALLGDLAVADRPGVAVAVNDTVVPRPQWHARTLQGGDRVLLIHASQGG
jgi:sulfur carrier protein